MNVLYVLSETTPSYGGIGAYTYKLIKGLLKKQPEYKATLLTCNQYQDDSFSHYFKNNDRVKIISIFNKNIKQLFLRDITFQMKVVSKIYNIIKNEEIEIIHHQTGHYDLFFIINFLNQIPKIMTSHGDTYTLLEKWKKGNLTEINEKINYYSGKLLYQEEKHLYKKSNKIITVADHVKQNLINFYDIKPEKIEVIYNLVYPEEFNFQPGNFNKPYKIGFIGRPYYIKGFYDLIYLLNNEKDKDLFQWYLVTDSQKVKKSVKNTKNIHFIESIPQSKLSEFYNMLDIIFIPSFSEACPTVLIESLLKGKLCIARDIVGITEIAKNCEVSLFKDITEVNLKKIIQSFDNDGAHLLKILENNRNMVTEGYNTKNILNSIYQLYEKTLKDK